MSKTNLPDARYGLQPEPKTPEEFVLWLRGYFRAVDRLTDKHPDLRFFSPALRSIRRRLDGLTDKPKQ